MIYYISTKYSLMHGYGTHEVTIFMWAKLTVELFGQRYCSGTSQLYEGGFHCIEQKFTEQVSCANILYNVILERGL